jgi:hypothetical protein
MTNQEKIHAQAADVILAAAEQSGLLREVAEALCCFDRWPVPSHSPLNGWHPSFVLRDTLAAAFDDHTCTPAVVMEDFYGEGFSPTFSDAELAPYLRNPQAADTP